MSTHLTILIAGAGIAGLALARALRHRGVEADIVERASGPSQLGAGLYVPGNGTRAIERLGLGDALRARAAPIAHQRILDQSGRQLAQVDVADVWRSVGPCVGITRADLHQILLGSAVAITPRFDTTIAQVHQTPGSVAVTFGSGEQRNYDAVVGADGLRSSLRTLAFGHHPPRPVGQACWRFLVDDATGITGWTAMLSRTRAFLAVPMGAKGAYCYADVLTPRTSAAAHVGPGDLRAHFAAFARPVPDFLDQINVDAVHVGSIEEVDVHPCVNGRIALIGDAAHATSPNMAQGAAMAIEDALVLAELLAADRPVVESLSLFSARRRSRVDWVRKRSHQRDRIRTLPVIIRNLAVRLAGSSIYRRDYAPLFDLP